MRQAYRWLLYHDVIEWRAYAATIQDPDRRALLLALIDTFAHRRTVALIMTLVMVVFSVGLLIRKYY